MEKGKYVLRSTYQKQVAENKKLLNDIRILTEENPIGSIEKIQLIIEWRKKFNEDKMLAQALKKWAEEGSEKFGINKNKL